MSWILTDGYIRDTIGLGESAVCQFRNTPELHGEDFDKKVYKIVTDNDEVFNFFNCLFMKNKKHRIETLILDNKTWFKEKTYINGLAKEKVTNIKGPDLESKYLYIYNSQTKLATIMRNGHLDKHYMYYDDGKLFKLIDSDVVIGYEYDDKGNLIIKRFEYKQGKNILYYHVYDDDNNLVAMTTTNGGWAHYTYNNKGSVLTHTNSTQRFEYTYAADGVTKIGMVKGYDRWDYIKGTKNGKLLKFDVSKTIIHRR